MAEPVEFASVFLQLNFAGMCNLVEAWRDALASAENEKTQRQDYERNARIFACLAGVAIVACAFLGFYIGRQDDGWQRIRDANLSRPAGAFFFLDREEAGSVMFLDDWQLGIVRNALLAFNNTLAEEIAAHIPEQ